MQPGSDQYSGISPMQAGRAYAILPAAGAWDVPTEIPCVGMGRLTLFVEYLRGAPNGAAEMLLEVSPFSTVIAAALPVGITEWYPLCLVEQPGVVAGADSTALLQRNILRLTSTGADREGFTFDVNLPDYSEQFRVSFRESGVVNSPGNLGYYAILSVKGEASTGLTDPMWEAVQDAHDDLNANANIQVNNTDAAFANPVPSRDTWRVDLQSDLTADDSDKSFTVPATTEWQVLWIWVEYTSTAVAGNRQLEIQLQTTGPDVIGSIRPSIVQAASFTYNYMFGSSLPDLLALRDTDLMMTPIPPTLLLQAGDIVRVFDNNAVDAAADDMLVFIQIAARTV